MKVWYLTTHLIPSDIRLSKEDTEKLEGKFTMQELHKAIFGLKRGKCPRCDGLLAEFYVTFFMKLNDLLLEAYNLRYDNNELYPSALRGIISMILKCRYDTRVLKNIRPISILAIGYKNIKKNG